ncbi:MAG: glutaredoxin [candidate division Zixibacteria bacterium]|nr:glutaredoxin [candidate division Zixibacteria bacterium]NIR66836.1 glutaredoxin [candidate division Zixibacteria bacterium]NIS15215.1 glutaredoxin [candidate division Zixibacteria bacterium]NIS48335.1 glutaredoxin [candidate division Zixibacteria bacterium]NIT51729.1 glutaredoxin [candidate division Zixibacteria bacterium]
MKFIQENDAEILKRQFAEYSGEVKFIYFKKDNDCETCGVAQELLEEVKELSDKIKLTIYDYDKDEEQVKKYAIDKVPALVIEGEKDYGIRFYGVPSGYEFNSLLNAMYNVSKGEIGLPGIIREDLDKIQKDIHVQVFVTPTCPHCPGAVKTAQNFAMYSGRIKADMVEVSEFPELARKYQVMSVPKVVINENIDFVGALGEREYLEKILEANA